MCFFVMITYDLDETHCIVLSRLSLPTTLFEVDMQN
jgi:hypothetical protein